MSRKNSKIVSFDGDPCPRCKRATTVYEHLAITEKQLKQSYYFTRWFCCANKHCSTTMIMSEQYKVQNGKTKPKQPKVSDTQIWGDTWEEYDKTKSPSVNVDGCPPWE